MAAFSTRDVVTALQTLSVAKTRELVFRLGVPVNVLENIDMDYSGTNRNIQYIDAWVNNATKAGWKQVVSGLKEIDINVLAEEVESTYLSNVVEAPLPITDSAFLSSATSPPSQSLNTPAQLEAVPLPVTTSMTTAGPELLTPAVNLSQPPAVDMERVVKVKVAIEKFKDELIDLKFDAQVFLSEKESKDVKFLARFRNYLLELSVSERAIHIKFFELHKSDIRAAENVEIIFDILRHYCSYFNYDLILTLIRKFCDETLQKRMLDYHHSFETFEKATTVDIYLHAISAYPKGKLFQAFTKMAMTIKMSASECTLYQIRTLKKSLAMDAHIHQYSVFIDEQFVNQSVGVVLCIPSSCVVWTGMAVTPNFMEEHHLSKVSIDGIDIGYYQDRVC